ncbi:VOC family protein [Actinosynnema sp. CS-041913]|uniref:VOC family protein n=1 Tax=Actinosynnema sp. CS-041913 TaxID=3239917 RepID=UPI003D946233
MSGPSASPARGVRRIELATADPEPIADFYAHLLGWVVLAEPDGAFTGWVGDRLAARVHPGEDGYRVVFAGAGPRGLRAGASVDQGRVLHGPWAPGPRAGEPCWVEFTGAADDGYWTGELGWEARTPDERFTLYDTPGEQPRAVAGRLVGERQRWTCYFAVPDTAKTAALAAETGGEVLVPPTEVPTGLVASIADPAGAVFAVLQDPPGWGGTWSTQPAAP